MKRFTQIVLCLVGLTLSGCATDPRRAEGSSSTVIPQGREQVVRMDNAEARPVPDRYVPDSHGCKTCWRTVEP